jgi:hypothetical protein
MNGSTGEKKVEAIAALLNRLVQERKAMQHRMAEMHMQMMGTPGPAGEGTPSAPERMAAREMQQRLAAEREVARKQAEEAIVEARALADRAAAAREEAEKAINEARREAERAAAAQKAAVKQFEADRARREAEKEKK